LKTEERKYKRIKELMGIKSKLITEAGYDDSVADYLGSGLSAAGTIGSSIFGSQSSPNTWELDPEKGTSPGGIDVTAAASSAVNAAGGVARGRELIGNTPISQGFINHMVLKYFDGTEAFGLTYSFRKDIIIGDSKILAGKSFSTKNATFVGATNTILVDTPTSEGGEKKDDDKVVTGDTYTTKESRNKKLVDLFNQVGINLDSKDPLVIYFRKNIRPVLRRLKKEFPEYKINFTDQSTKLDTEEGIVKEHHFLNIKDILLEGYKETLTQLMKLKAAKNSMKKDKKMTAVLDQQIQKERKKLLDIIKPKIQKVFKENSKSLQDEDMIRFVIYLNAFLSKLKKDYPQYNINYGELILKEELEIFRENEMSITLAKEQTELYVGRTYPCTVKVGETDTGKNDVTIVDVNSRFVNKGNNTPKKTTTKGKTDKKEEEGEGYVFPSASNYGDKDKTFHVTMIIDVEPINHLKSNPATDMLKAYKSYVYVVSMLFNGFEIRRINSSDFMNQDFDSQKVKFIFDKEDDQVIFNFPYQVEVIAGDENLGKLNITIEDIQRKQ